MKVLMVHNYYQQRGGEDGSFEAEAALLERYGHEVLRYTLHNDSVNQMHPLRVAGRTVWSRSAKGELGDLLQRERPDVMHCTNTFPLISPSAYYPANAAGVAVVQSLRNYRLGCVNAQYLRNGQICEKCLGKPFAWPGVVHACYRGSRAGSATVAGMNAAHRALGTWTRRVDRYFTLTRFARDKSIQAGLGAERISIKPNFLDPDPGPGTPPPAGGFAMFVGRLSKEKGVQTLVDAWAQLDGPIELKIVGDGPLLETVRDAAAHDWRITVLGKRSADQVLDLLGQAACLVMPSIWYETFGRTIMEAFACSTPAVVSNLGAMAELVEPGRTGRNFEPANAQALAATVSNLFEQRDHMHEMGKAARQTFLERYTGEQNHEQLMEIYQGAMARSSAARAGENPTHEATV